MQRLTAVTSETMDSISPKHLNELRRAGKIVDLIDVRTPAEYAALHAEGARNLPLDRLDLRMLLEGKRSLQDEPLYVICHSGGRAREACKQLLAAGYPNAVNIEGGMIAWEQSGLPVVRGQNALSLERQVRIAAGSLVLLGTALGAFVHSWLLVLPAFVGAGLIFAGVTDACGMAMLLGRMPWNKAANDRNLCTL